MSDLIQEANEFFKWPSDLLRATEKIRGKSLTVFDIENYPNYTTVSTLDKDGFHFATSTMQGFLEKAHSLFNQNSIAIGFNNFAYDNVVLNRLSSDPMKNYILGQQIIKGQLKDVTQEVTLFNDSIQTLDLIGLRGPKEMMGLKGIGAKSNPYRIQELPYHFTKELTQDERKFVLQYNLNDCVTTYQFLKTKLNDIKLRLALMDKYELSENMFCRFASAKGASVAEQLIRVLYTLDGNKANKLVDFYPKVEFIKVSEMIPEVEFKNESLSMYYDMLRSLSVSPFDFRDKLKTKVTVGSLDIDLGSGGAHSAIPGDHSITDETLITDVDVTSYYPSLILAWSLKPRHLSNSFLDVYSRIVADRKEAKKAGDKFTADALKLVINSTFGKFNNAAWSDNGEMEYSSFLYDWTACLKVTLHGQIFLLKLIEMFHDKGICVISANTDGLTVKYKKSNLASVDSVIAEWEKLTFMGLEKHEYKLIHIEDVNNYIALDTDGEMKAKGRFVEGSGNTPEVIVKACQEYILKQTPIDTTIRQEKDINAFVSIVNIKEPFVGVYNGKEVQHVVRYYHSSSKTPLLKVDGRRIINVPDATSVSIVETRIDSIPKNIDYEKYIKLSKDMLGLSDQLELF